jgi:hypothetical protein
VAAPGSDVALIASFGCMRATARHDLASMLETPEAPFHDLDDESRECDMRFKMIVAIIVAWLGGWELTGVHEASAQEKADSAAGPPASPCAKQSFREFDFWVGEWEVRTDDGKIAGENRITSEENGCAIVEHWRSAAGGTGQSLNYFDPAANRWKQEWVGVGVILHMEGGLRNGAMIMEGPLQYLGENRVTRLRGTWTPLADGRVRQLFEESVDDGKTWKPWFDGYYTRRSRST